MDDILQQAGLHTSLTPGAEIIEVETGTYRLSIPANEPGTYRLAQLDDYLHLPRRKYPWKPPAVLDMQARVSELDLPGTWGFGFWNDPFNFRIKGKGVGVQLPVLPNAAWLFHASGQNHLSFHNSYPYNGMLSAVFRADIRLSIKLFTVALLLPGLMIPTIARLIRRLLGQMIQEDGFQGSYDPTEWHRYRVEWSEDMVFFKLDGSTLFETNISPYQPCGLVIWIDNMYKSFPPDGHFRSGTSGNPEPAWMEIRNLSIVQL